MNPANSRSSLRDHETDRGFDLGCDRLVQKILDPDERLQATTERLDESMKNPTLDLFNYCQIAEKRVSSPESGER